MGLALRLGTSENSSVPLLELKVYVRAKIASKFLPKLSLVANNRSFD